LRQYYKLSVETIIKGDALVPLIGAASIAAKVTRDRHMIRLAKRYPEYGFDRHKGYGTHAHIDAIQQFGLCKEHRASRVK
jgi:ribonuclease HII